VKPFFNIVVHLYITQHNVLGIQLKDVRFQEIKYFYQCKLESNGIFHVDEGLIDELNLITKIQMTKVTAEFG
jgi:hypothetical protein